MYVFLCTAEELNKQDETQDILPDDITFPEQIPDDIIFEHYDGVCFVPDDFCCTAGQDY